VGGEDIRVNVQEMKEPIAKPKKRRKGFLISDSFRKALWRGEREKDRCGGDRFEGEEKPVCGGGKKTTAERE